MKILAIIGSARSISTNRALLHALRNLPFEDIEIAMDESIHALPIFNPDLEGTSTPDSVARFCKDIAEVDGLIIASPEYVHAIPGGLKNALDWLVSRDEIIHKPIALAHASHRGDDMLTSLRLVLNTITSRFAEHVFVRISLVSASPTKAAEILATAENTAALKQFLAEFHQFIDQTKAEAAPQAALPKIRRQ